MLDCLIVEDEKSAQEILREYIKKTPFLKCIGSHESGLGIPNEQIKQADILFLDIQLPELNGLAYLKTITIPPKVIITTAYANYAVEAFEVNVLDYLVKPFAYERFFKAVSRAKDQLKMEQNEMDKQFFLYADKSLHRIQVEDIIYLKAEIDYVKIVTKKKALLVLDSLQNWEEKLAVFNFKRVHRSYIINLDSIDKVTGNQVFIDDKAIPIGKVYKSEFLRRMGLG